LESVGSITIRPDMHGEMKAKRQSGGGGNSSACIVLILGTPEIGFKPRRHYRSLLRVSLPRVLPGALPGALPM